MNLLIFAGQSDSKLRSKLEPLISSPKVKRVFLIRNQPIALDKTTTFTPPRFLRVPVFQEIFKMLAALWVCLRHRMSAVLGFYFLPHGILAFVLGQIFRKPVLQISLGQDILFLNRYPRLARILLKNASRVGTRGRQSEKAIQALLPEHPLNFWIPHNQYAFPINPAPTKLELKTIDILCLGKFFKVKRVDIFLNVIAKVRKHIPEIRAVFVGGDPEKNPHRDLMRSLQLESSVEFHPYTLDTRPYFEQSKVFLLTSETEGLPMAMLEAMSYGLPCVLPSVGDIPDVALHGHNALLVPALDTDAFAAQTLRLLKDPLLHATLSKNALETLRSKKQEYSGDAIRSAWETVLTDSDVR